MFNFFRKKSTPAKTSRTFLSSSEFVSSGHPDRLADNLAAIVIQDIQAKDGPCSHAAIEVFITHDSVIFGGEATTTLNISADYLRSVVSKGFYRSGYIREMRKYWSKNEVVLASNMQIVNKICAQSPDIALGTTDKGEESGWNDQGVYFSSADNSTDGMIGSSQYIAMKICEGLQEISRESILDPGKYGNPLILGPDNKAVVTFEVADDGFTPIQVKAVTVAVAHSALTNTECVRSFVKSYVLSILKNEGCDIAEDCQWIINGTGRFVVHGPISDTSMTGRKISVNHPSAGPLWANKMIGGGSLVKPSHASDLILNVASRYIANVIVHSGLSSYAVVGCAGAIGVQGLQSLFIKGDAAFEKNPKKDEVINYFNNAITWAPIAIAKKFGFFSSEFDFGKIVDRNFFGHPEVQPWEDLNLIDKEATELFRAIGE